MAASQNKPLRCAIYTRKSTEHGLELEFNSLHAQRDACAAYIKSQASQGWKILPRQYDDAAFSGGNLERPALKALLADIESGLVDVIVVYKIDRLTRSLADFAKLVEMFDKKSVSFVAVTQQFNTTSSMGRLTLNVLLSFAQFERELSSERVRDKIAASRAKGKWTGGSVPLGYEAHDKKLVVNAKEAETVRYIFKKYLELKSFSRLVGDLDRRGIVTKRRNTSVDKYKGGIPFTYGPLAHFLKNRVYLGQTHHKGKWFPGEHQAVLDKKTFDHVQQLLETNRGQRRIKRSASGALLIGKLVDDRGNRMSPSFSVKNGVRYRFYVSSALLRGRKASAGVIPRVSAQEIEDAIETALRTKYKDNEFSREQLFATISKAAIRPKAIDLSIKPDDERLSLSVAWLPRQKVHHDLIEPNALKPPDQKIVQAVARAHCWIDQLQRSEYASVDQLARKVDLHPKLLRNALRLAFLAPDITQALLEGRHTRGFQVSRLALNLPLRWEDQRALMAPRARAS